MMAAAEPDDQQGLGIVRVMPLNTKTTAFLALPALEVAATQRLPHQLVRAPGIAMGIVPALLAKLWR